MATRVEFYIATRKSPLALWQANTTKQLLRDQGVQCEIQEIITTGDKIQHTQLSQVNLESPQYSHLSTGKGLFIKEIQEALLAGKAHIAVHSMKDLPVAQTAGLCIAALLPRASPNDVLVLSPKLLNEIHSDFTKLNLVNFDKLKMILLKSKIFASSPVGTTSTRRQFFMKNLFFQDLDVQVLRGNVDSRLKKVNENKFAAILLAQAGLERLDLFCEESMYCLPVHEFIPAAAQGVVAIECSRDNIKLIQTLKKISCLETCLQVSIERMVLYFLHGDCNSTIGIHLIKENIYILYKKLNVEKNIIISILTHDMDEVKNLFDECDGLYGVFFERLLISSFGNKIKNILNQNSVPV